MSTQPDTYTGDILVLTRIFDAPPKRVFAAWTDPQLLAQWWGPPGSVVKEVEVDLRVDGRYRIGILHPEGELLFVRGVYREIEPVGKLAFTWRWENPNMDIGESLVTLEFQAEGEKTELRLSHALLPNAEARAGHAEGWEGILSELGDFLGNS
ncbi:MAG: SRPBCC domain-containing protein [Chloroflexi bacterium]|nr:SRPBCC domain-containing protein [Chloroflexota bacterium]